MSWSTELFCNISFNRKTYNTKYEVETDLEELDKNIENCKRELRDLAIMTEPEKFYDKEDYTSPYDFVSRNLEENLELLEEFHVEKWKLEILLNNWDKCHNKEGLAIDPPNEISWDTAYLHGDFVNSVKYPDPNKI